MESISVNGIAKFMVDSAPGTSIKIEHTKSDPTHSAWFNGSPDDIARLLVETMDQFPDFADAVIDAAEYYKISK